MGPRLLKVTYTDTDEQERIVVITAIDKKQWVAIKEEAVKIEYDQEVDALDIRVQENFVATPLSYWHSCDSW